MAANNNKVKERKGGQREHRYIGILPDFNHLCVSLSVNVTKPTAAIILTLLISVAGVISGVLPTDMCSAFLQRLHWNSVVGFSLVKSSHVCCLHFASFI